MNKLYYLRSVLTTTTPGSKLITQSARLSFYLSNDQLENYLQQCEQKKLVVLENDELHKLIKSINPTEWSLKKADSDVIKDLNLPRKSIDKLTLKRVADRFTQKEMAVLKHNNRRMALLNKIHHFTNENGPKLRYIVNGQSIVNANKQEWQDNLVRVINMLPDDGKVLVAMRPIGREILDAKLRSNDNLDYLIVNSPFNLQRYMYYAGIRSRRHDQIYFVSHGSFEFVFNELIDETGHEYEINRWMLERRVQLDKNMTKLIYPFDCDVQVKKITPDKWILTTLQNDNQNLVFYLLEKKNR